MIYFAQDESTLHIKIGFTDADDATERVRQLQTGNPSPIILLCSTPGDRDFERLLHQKYAAARVAGEWFRPVPRLLELLLFISRCQAIKELQRHVAGLFEAALSTNE